jgi:hypothetical protein
MSPGAFAALLIMLILGLTGGIFVFLYFVVR